MFVESTPLEVYRDYIGIVGKPTKSDAPYEQYAKPLWNSWAQFYTKVDQEKLLDYATDLHDNGLDGHTIQLDDKWESNYGNPTWDPKTLPRSPRASPRRSTPWGSTSASGSPCGSTRTPPTTSTRSTTAICSWTPRTRPSRAT